MNSAHLGIALDGDGDRCILVDERGALVGGDAIAYLFWCAPAMVWLTFCGGVVLTALFSRYSHRMGRLYAADLLGAGAGSLACLGLMKLGSPPLAFVAGLVPVAAALLPYQRELPRRDPQRGCRPPRTLPTAPRSTRAAPSGPRRSPRMSRYRPLGCA